MSDIQNFDNNGFWGKVLSTFKAVGYDLIVKILTLYYCMMDDDTPIFIKAIIVGALVYFVSPVDAIPDIIPFAGYSDDAGVIATTIATVAPFIKEEHKQQARNKVNEFFK